VIECFTIRFARREGEGIEFGQPVVSKPRSRSKESLRRVASHLNRRRQTEKEKGREVEI